MRFRRLRAFVFIFLVISMLLVANIILFSFFLDKKQPENNLITAIDSKKETPLPSLTPLNNMNTQTTPAKTTTTQTPVATPKPTTTKVIYHKTTTRAS